MGDDGGYGDSSGGGWGSNNNYADSSYNNYSYSNDTNDFANKYSSFGDKNEDSRGYTKYEPSSKYEEKTYETPKSYESPSKIYEEPAKVYEESRTNLEDTRQEPPSTIAPPPPVPESQSYHTKSEPNEPEAKSSIVDVILGVDDDDDDEELKFKKDTPNENVTVTTAEINTPPGATCDHKTLALLLGKVTTAQLTSPSDHDEAELQALASIHDACKCNGNTDKVAADGIDLDETKENTDLLNDSSETRAVDDKPVEDDDCMLNVLSFCVTCCDCVIS